jgi:hypothetical protein
VAYQVRPWDREWFKRCRRSWDFGSRARRNLEPVAPSPTLPIDLDRALRDALAVYYFPGMWEWDRSVVVPLAFVALEKALGAQRARREATTPLTPTETEDWERQLATGRGLLERYLEWAPSVDRFWPVRVETDFDVAVPDPRHPGHDLVSPAGEAIRYQGRVDMLVVDEHDAYWVVRHRLIDRFADIELLVLDDEPVAACWAWELFYLGMRVAGTVHNELRVVGAPPEPADPVRRPRAGHAWARARAAGHRRMYVRGEWEPDEVVVEEGGDLFRRTRIPRSRAELDGLGARLAHEALDMVDPDLLLYPTPAPEHCSACPFRAPCLAVNEGGDAETILTERFRERPTEVPEEGRLGAVTWSMNRGAAPPPQWARRDRPR